MTTGRRIVVLTAQPGYAVRKGVVEIDRAIADLSWLVVVHSPRRPLGQLLRNQWRNLRRNGWRWLPHMAEDIRHRLSTRHNEPNQPGLPGSEFTLAALRARPNLRIIEVEDIHAADSLQAIREFEPDLGLSLAAPILRRPLFSIPKHGTINLHKGKVPDYRGMPPAFWELWNGESSVGCTVHRVDDGLDTGEVIRETSIDRQRFSTLRGLQHRLDEVGVDLMREAVQDILDGRLASLPQRSGGKTFRKPTLAQAAQLRRRLCSTQPRSRSGARNAAKEAYFGASLPCLRAGLRRLLPPRITVLLYHRVSDDARDNLTVGIEQFDRQMALLRARCEVLSIERVIECPVVPRTGAPLVAVTFDDGYLDNYLNAAPILQRHRIPAAFFISTGIVGTDRRFPHDVRRGNAPIPVMQWDHLRRMRDQGFTIGSHSVSHIDCAAEDETTVRHELAQSRADLERELGLERLLFAYPYGGRHNMTPARLELVKQAGFVGCLSAYGGSNVATVDRYNVLRRGIHWEFSDRAFLFECMGLR